VSLSFYKKGQGYYTRLCTALAGGLLAGLGCLALREKLSGITPGAIITASVKPWFQDGIPLVIFAVLGWLIFKLVNMVKFADFLIATEGEMKKVSWSSKKEIVTSTKVVIFTVIVMALLLAAVDFGFYQLFAWIGVIKEVAK